MISFKENYLSGLELINTFALINSGFFIKETQAYYNSYARTCARESLQKQIHTIRSSYYLSWVKPREKDFFIHKNKFKQHSPTRLSVAGQIPLCLYGSLYEYPEGFVSACGSLL